MVYMFLADGFEETEAFVTLDILRRADIEIKTAAVTGENSFVTGSHGITVKGDISQENLLGLTDISSDFYIDFKGVILPGGPGHRLLKNSPPVSCALEYAYKNGHLIAAICAAPTVAAEKGYLKGIRGTCFPSSDLREAFENGGAVPEYCSDVVTDKNFITARSAGTSVNFGIAIVEYFLGYKKSLEVYDSFTAKR